MSSRGHGTCLKCKQEFFNIDQNPQTAHAAAFNWMALLRERRRKQNKVTLQLWKSVSPCTLAAVLTKVTVASLPVVETHGCVHA